MNPCELQYVAACSSAVARSRLGGRVYQLVWCRGGRADNRRCNQLLQLQMSLAGLVSVRFKPQTAINGSARVMACVKCTSALHWQTGTPHTNSIFVAVIIIAITFRRFDACHAQRRGGGGPLTLTGICGLHTSTSISQARCQQMRLTPRLPCLPPFWNGARGVRRVMPRRRPQRGQGISR